MTDVTRPRLINMQRTYNVNPTKLNRFHGTGLKLLELILSNVRNIVEKELTIEWFKILVTTGDVIDIWTWVNNNFSSPLRESIIKLVERGYDFAFKSLKQGLNRFHGWIYRGIVSYIYDYARINRINSITPWDILNILTNNNKESLIKSLMFPSNNVTVSFSLNGTEIPTIYDLNLDQFMGIILIATLLSKDNRIIRVNIYDITHSAIGFLQRLLDYNNEHHQKKYLLTVPQHLVENLTNIYYFENIDFLSGFMTPFNWINNDYHNFWTEFKEIGDKEFPEGRLLQF